MGVEAGGFVESRSVMGVEIILMDLRKEKLSPDLLSL